MFPGEACSRNPERGPLWTQWTNHPGGPCSPGTGCPRMIGVNSKHPQVSVKRAVRKKKKNVTDTCSINEKTKAGIFTMQETFFNLLLQ